MVKISRELIHQLHKPIREGGQGKTFADIGEMFKVSRQYIHSLYTGYASYYRKTEKSRMYSRHYKTHIQGGKPYKPCDYCQQVNRQQGSQISSSNIY